VGGGGEAIDLCGEEGEEVCLPAISTVWECVYINYKDVNGKEGWECQWCGLSFKPRHATRAMRHVLKLKGGDIANCKAVISAKYRDVAMSGTTSPVTVGIIDCTTHMAEGGKKDAAYISGIFDEKVMEYDPKMSLTDLFFFNGASNVQKAGQVLMAKFPRTFCLHGTWGGTCCLSLLHRYRKY
jgi:hypothetical protein